MNRALGHLRAHIGKTGPGEPPEDGEMIGMTLPSRHRIRNSSPGGLRSSTLPLGHGGSPQYWLSHVDGEESYFCFFQTAETGNQTPNSGVKGSCANHYPRAPALQIIKPITYLISGSITIIWIISTNHMRKVWARYHMAISTNHLRNIWVSSFHTDRLNQPHT